MIPLILVTGFLGSGKTSLLRHLAAKARKKRIAFVVNEFAHEDIDARLLARETPDVEQLPGGSLFCTCLVHEFIGLLDLIPRKYGDSLDAVVVEASGVANPEVTAKLLRDARLDSVYDLRLIVSVVDPGSFPVLLQTLPNIRAQVAASDLVILNKIDLHPPQTVRDVEALVKEIRDVRVVYTVHGVLEFDLLALAYPHPGQRGELAPCRDPHYVMHTISLDGPADLERIALVLEKLGAPLYRVKGHVATVSGVWRVDYSAGRCTTAPAPDWDGPRQVVVIGDGARPAEVAAAADALRAAWLVD
jgi:G3E family GTPase